MNQFPRMLYKFPGVEAMHGGLFATRTVADEDEQEAAIADGWHLTTPEAKEAHAESQKPAAVIEPAKMPEAAPEAAEDTDAGADNAVDDGTLRAELKAKAAALGLVYPRNATNEKLAELIAAAPAKE